MIEGVLQQRASCTLAPIPGQRDNEKKRKGEQN
jgi:hypothetical protein